MLEKSFRFTDPDLKTKYPLFNVDLKRCTDWSSSKRRVLIVLQNVFSGDLKAHELMGCPLTKNTITNCIKYSRKLALPYRDGQPLPNAAYAVVNFNEFKSLHLARGPRADADHQFAQRIHKLIAKLQPTHVLVAGDEAMNALYPQIANPWYKRGWIFKAKADWGTYTYSSSLDLSRLLEKQGQFANLLGLWCRHLMALQMGQNPHDLSYIKAKPKYIKTLEQFDELMNMLDKAKEVGVDTETRNLSVLSNKLYTIQFATTEDRGYIVTVDHPLGHWTPEERTYIKKRLRKFFSARKGPMLVTFNGMYDLRVIRQQLKIPIMRHKVWEITAGEHLLDENVTELNSATTARGSDGKSLAFGGLAPILCTYGNEHYFTAAFAKSDRGSIGSIDPARKDFQEYASMDAQCLIGMKKQQIRRASRTSFLNGVYKPYFVRHMLYQMSDTVHTLSQLRTDGSKIDRKYLKLLKSAESPLVSELKKIRQAFRAFKEVQKANQQLLDESGFKAKGLFASTKEEATTSWVFNLGKTAHKKKLFFDILGLDPVSKTKTGENAIDKAFIGHYKDKNKIVSMYGDYQALFKLITTYVKGWNKRLRTNLDSVVDGFLRADYSFWQVVTGRLASMNPNLQQIPSRGKLAKIIKRMFVAPKGYLLVRYDYSAHEVRMWSVASGDEVLAKAFKAGQKLRQQFIQDPTDENRAKIKKDGDIHLLNVRRFFNKVVDKDHPLRDAVKAVIFGLIYGKGPAALGEDTKKGDLDVLKAQLSKVYDELWECKDPKRRKELASQMDEIDSKLTALLDEDRRDYAQGIIDKLFSEFKKAAAWTRKMQQLAENDYYVYSPIGRRRYLPAGLTGDRAIIAEQVRRGSNAPIQGFASELGIGAARLITETYNDHLSEFLEQLGLEGSAWDWRIQYSRVVHDANYYAVPYAMVVPFLHILQHCATYGVTERYERRFNMKFTVEPEIEAEVAAKDDSSYKWDWSMPNIIQGLKSAVADAQELGVLEGKPDQVLAQILKPWKSKKSREYLQEHFPLLGVPNLDQQIKGALAPQDNDATV